MEMPMLESEFLSITEAAPLIGVKPNTLRLMCVKRLIRHIKVGAARGIYRFRPEWIDEYLAASEVSPSTQSVAVALPVHPVKRPTKTIPPRIASELFRRAVERAK
jgi:hypothetical protein